jgi:hypothetical protein
LNVLWWISLTSRSVKPHLSSKHPERIPNELLEAHMVVVYLFWAFFWEGVYKARYPLHLQFSGIRPATIFTSLTMKKQSSISKFWQPAQIV